MEDWNDEIEMNLDEIRYTDEEVIDAICILLDTTGHYLPEEKLCMIHLVKQKLLKEANIQCPSCLGYISPCDPPCNTCNGSGYYFSSKEK